MTWQDFLNSIPFRLNRDDLPADFVEEMANEQITLFGPQLFAPSEQTSHFSTQPGQYFYPLPAGFQRLTYVRVLQGGIWIPVAIADSYTDVLSVDPMQPPFTSLPVSLVRVYGNQIRLFPTPNTEYQVELTMMGTVLGPTNPDDDTNFWTNDGNVFLRAATCLAICQEYLDQNNPNSPRVQMWQTRSDISLVMLQTQAHQRTQPSYVKQYL